MKRSEFLSRIMSPEEGETVLGELRRFRESRFGSQVLAEALLQLSELSLCEDAPAKPEDTPQISFTWGQKSVLKKMVRRDGAVARVDFFGLELDIMKRIEKLKQGG